MHSINDIEKMSLWIVDYVAKNRSSCIDQCGEWNWDHIASVVWKIYPGKTNEFIINDAIDLIIDAYEGTD